MLDDVYGSMKEAVDKAHQALGRDLAKLRTGRASVSILDGIRADYYGQPTPLNQMAAISVPEPRLIVIRPWDKAGLHAVERAILVSDLGLTPTSDGEFIRIPIPPLTEERRRDLVKIARKMLRSAKSPSVMVGVTPTKCSTLSRKTERFPRTTPFAARNTSKK